MSCSALFQYVIHAPSASLREGGRLLPAKRRRAECRLESSSLSLPRRARKGLGMRGRASSAAVGILVRRQLRHIAMETGVCSGLEKGETNPIPSSLFFFKAILNPTTHESSLRGSLPLQPLVTNQPHTENSENCVTQTCTESIA